MKKTLLKTLCFIMAAIMFLGVMAGCSGKSDDADKSGDETKNDDASEQTQTEKPSNSSDRKGDGSYTISDEVLVDDDNCSFTITKAEDGDSGFTLNALCENKTSDKNLIFTIDNVSVNGYMVTTIWWQSVAPGSSANDKIIFPSFEEAGISKADKIVFTLRVFDEEDWSADNYVNEVFTIYPTGLSDSDVVSPARRTTDSEQVIVDNDDFTFIILESGDEEWFGYSVKCYIENKTDKNLMFAWDDVSVNGFMADPYWAVAVAAGMKSYSDIPFLSEDLEDIGIETVEKIVFTLRVYDPDDWSADNYVNEVFTVYPTGFSDGDVVPPARRTTDSEQVVVDNDDFTFIILESGDDEWFGYSVKCYLENKTDKNLMFAWDDVSVNGFMVDPYWSHSVAAGKKSYSDISFWSEDLEDNGIETVEDIEFSLRVYDGDDWLADDLFNGIGTYNP